LDLLDDEVASDLQIVVDEFFNQVLHGGFVFEFVAVAFELLVEAVHQADAQGLPAGDEGEVAAQLVRHIAGCVSEEAAVAGLLVVEVLGD